MEGKNNPFRAMDEVVFLAHTRVGEKDPAVMETEGLGGTVVGVGTNCTPRCCACSHRSDVS